MVVIRNTIAVVATESLHNIIILGYWYNIVKTFIVIFIKKKIKTTR